MLLHGFFRFISDCFLVVLFGTRQKKFILLKLGGMQSLIFAAILFCPPPCSAGDESVKTFSTPRFTLHVGATKTSALSASPFVDDAVSQSLQTLNSTYDELKRVFAETPKQRVTLRFLSPDEFREATGSPAWTSAMYFGGEISVPIASKEQINLRHLKRALRHEYVHAVVAELSGSRCPAWLDEGLAQLIEGEVNPLLGPALRKWIKRNSALPLHSLENGFTLLDDDLVPAAYAQSLFVARTLVNRRGFEAMRTYLRLLREERSLDQAFQDAFAISQDNFENHLTSQIRRWAESGNSTP